MSRLFPEGVGAFAHHVFWRPAILSGRLWRCCVRGLGRVVSRMNGCMWARMSGKLLSHDVLRAKGKVGLNARGIGATNHERTGLGILRANPHTLHVRNVGRAFLSCCALGCKKRKSAIRQCRFTCEIGPFVPARIMHQELARGVHFSLRLVRCSVETSVEVAAIREKTTLNNLTKRQPTRCFNRALTGR